MKKDRNIFQGRRDSRISIHQKKDNNVLRYTIINGFSFLEKSVLSQFSNSYVCSALPLINFPSANACLNLFPTKRIKGNLQK